MTVFVVLTFKIWFYADSFNYPDGKYVYSFLFYSYLSLSIDASYSSLSW
jgi:hypothetical protein